jgi:hypothetical protein
VEVARLAFYSLSVTAFGTPFNDFFNISMKKRNFLMKEQEKIWKI